MSAEPRLSEMIGLRPRQAGDQVDWDDDALDREDDRSAPMWLINFVLLLLGGAILGVAFSFLDPAETQLIRNPWTYAVTTPIVLLLLSLLLNSLASRVVEKSMQLAFMLSVLIHLLLMVYAVNIVIMSRMWPNVLESFAAQREQLKRESLQAKQYFQPSTKTQSGQRPEYLRFVPTEHQPTEVEQAESPAIQLARSERSNLMTPSPRVTPTLSPHLLEREVPATSTPVPSDSSRALSRSELSRPDVRPSSPSRVEATESTPEPTLAASNIQNRRRDRSAERVSPAEVPQLPSQAAAPLTAASLARADLPSASPQPLSTQRSPQLAREMSSPTAPRGRPPTAPIPEISGAGEPEMAPEASLADASSTSRRSTQLAAPLMRMMPDAAQPEMANVTPAPTLPRRSELSSELRSELASSLPRPSRSDGEAASAIPRSVAGGLPGSAAPSSMPVQGLESAATPRESTETQLQATARSATRRNRDAGASSSPVSDAGLPQAATWNGSASLSGGLVGKSPSQLAAEAQGDAASVSDASLSGSGTAIARSQLGSMTPASGPAAATSSAAQNKAPQTDVAMEMSGAAGGGEQGVGLESAQAAIQRSDRRGRSGGKSSTNSLASATDAMANADFKRGEASGTEVGGAFRPERVDLGSDSLEMASGGARSAMELAASSGGEGVPAVASVQPLSEAVEGVVDSGEMGWTGLETRPTRSRGERGERPSTTQSAIEMDVDAVLGRGGISSLAELAGPVLPKRSERAATEAIREQLDSQRFSRQEVGGPLAAGRDVALPMPAFQQRLERLQDRDPQDETLIEPKTEQAIERGLAFLARFQRADGSWRLQDFDTPVLMRSDTAATGLALLAFQGAGYTHKQSKYADQVGRALKFLAEHQKSDGDLYIPQDPASDQNAWLYSHGIAALAVCEAYGMTQDPELKPMAQRAIDFMVSSQDKSTGGWRYRPGNGTDTSVTGWFMMAFKSGQLAGLQVPADTFRRIDGYLDASQLSPKERHLYRYNPFALNTPEQRHGLEPTAVMTSVGLLMRLYFGWQRDRPEMVAGADHLLGNLPRNGSRAASLRDTYYWYYATQVIFHMGGEHWKTWHDELYPLLIDSQVVRGENEGSWDPYRPTPDLWARYGGRLYVTTMNLLSLEVSYRHLPLYEATAK